MKKKRPSKGASVPRYSAADLVTLRTFIGPVVNSHISLYQQTRNGVHFWRAWIAVRRAMAIGVEIDIPPNMLEEIDRIAADLCNPKTKGQRLIAKAVRMTRPDGHGLGVSHANRDEKRRALMQELWAEACRQTKTEPARNARPKVPDIVMHRVAKRRKISPDALAMRWSRWWLNPSIAPERRDTFAALAEALKPKR